MPDIPWPAAPAPMNPIEMLRGIAGTQNLVNQNRLFQQDFASRQAVGKAFQDSVTPEGGVDYEGALTRMARDPNASFRLPEIANQIEQRKLTQLQAASAKLDMGIKQVDMVNRTLGGLTSLDSPTHDDVAKAAGTLVAELNAAGITEGYGDPLHMAKMLQKAPKDPVALRQWLQQAQYQGLQMKDQFDAIKGQIHLINQGGQGQAVQMSPGTGQARVLGTYGMTPTPGEANALVTGHNPAEGQPGHVPGLAEGAEFQQPRAAFAPMGGTGPAGFRATGTALGGAPAATGGVGGLPVRAPGAAAGTGAPAGGAGGGGGQGSGTPTGSPAGTAAVGSSGARGTGLGPTAAEAATGEGKNVADMEKGINEAVGTSLTLLPRLEEELGTLKKFTSGGGMESRTELAKMARAIGAPKEVADGIAGGSLASAQEFNMLIAQQAIEQLKQSLGGQGRITNLEVDTFFKKYPNLSTDPDAIEHIYNFLKSTSEKYYKQQQGLQEYKGLLSSGKLPGKTIGDFPAWYSKQAVGKGELNFKPTQGVPAGSTPPAATTNRKPLEDIFK